MAVSFRKDSLDIITKAHYEAAFTGWDRVLPDHLLRSMILDKESAITQYLSEKCNINIPELKHILDSNLANGPYPGINPAEILSSRITEDLDKIFSSAALLANIIANNKGMTPEIEPFHMLAALLQNPTIKSEGRKYLLAHNVFPDDIVSFVSDNIDYALKDVNVNKAKETNGKTNSNEKENKENKHIESIFPDFDEFLDIIKNYDEDLNLDEGLDASDMPEIDLEKLHKELNDAATFEEIELDVNEEKGKEEEKGIEDEKGKEDAKGKEEAKQKNKEQEEDAEFDPTNPLGSIMKMMNKKGGKHFGFAIQQPMAINLSGLVPEQSQKSKDPLKEYGINLNEQAAAGKLDPITGREREIKQVIEILGKRRKNNPMLIGEPGVGKSAIVEGIAFKINAGEVPEALKNKKIISIDMGSLVAGTQYRGSFEARLKSIIKACSENPDYILFADEIHTIVGAGHSEGGLDAANILKPALARGDIQCIGATTIKEFSTSIEKDGALNRRFQTVMIEPTDEKETMAILRRAKNNYESFHNVIYTDSALEACIKLTDRYITDKHLPDKAINAMDAAGSAVRLQSKKAKVESNNINAKEETIIIKAEHIAEVIARTTGIPVDKINSDKRKRLANMSKELAKKVVGQDDAVNTITKAIKRNAVGLKAPEKPIGSFLFTGPTGVGKTKLAKSLAEYLFDSEENLVRIDMSEYSDKYDVAKLIGAPPGYVGYNEGGQLTEKIRHKPYSVILFDEIEKADPEIFNTLLQVLDDGRLTDGNGRVTNFKNTVIIMTSNIGSRQAEDFGRSSGFTTPNTNISEDKKRIVKKSIKQTFAPEFLNRLDEIIYFNSLSIDDAKKIVDIELMELSSRVKEAGFKISITDTAKTFIANEGFDPDFGARPIKRTITKYVEDPISDALINYESKDEKPQQGKNVSSNLKMPELRVMMNRNGKDIKVKVIN